MELLLSRIHNIFIMNSCVIRYYWLNYLECHTAILFSACHDDINPHTLQLLDEVEFQLVTKAGKTSASNVQLLPVGTISREESVTDYQDGVVLRAMKSMDKKVCELCDHDVLIM